MSIEQRGNNPEQLGISLPQISNETRQRLVEELRLDSMNGRYNPCREFAESILTELASSNKDFIMNVSRNLHVVKRSWGRVIRDNADALDGYALGMAIVLGAYHYDSDFTLIDGFRNLDSADTAKASKLAKEIAEGDHSIFRKVLDTPRIPPHQVNLNELVLKMRETASQRDAAFMGSGMMYKFLSDFWPKLSLRADSTRVV